MARDNDTGPQGLILEMARTWKEGGGDAMGFNWCWSRILREIQKLEKPPAEQHSDDQA